MTQKAQPSIWVKKITQDFLECGGVFKWGVLGRRGRVLTFIKNIFFGFETLVFATLLILYVHEQLVTLQRQRKTWNQIIWAL